MKKMMLGLFAMSLAACCFAYTLEESLALQGVANDVKRAFVDKFHAKIFFRNVLKKSNQSSNFVMYWKRDLGMPIFVCGNGTVMKYDKDGRLESVGEENDFSEIRWYHDEFGKLAKKMLDQRKKEQASKNALLKKNIHSFVKEYVGVDFGEDVDSLGLQKVGERIRFTCNARPIKPSKDFEGLNKAEISCVRGSSRINSIYFYFDVSDEFSKVSVTNRLNFICRKFSKAIGLPENLFDYSPYRRDELTQGFQFRTPEDTSTLRFVPVGVKREGIIIEDMSIEETVRKEMSERGRTLGQ